MKFQLINIKICSRNNEIGEKSFFGKCAFKFKNHQEVKQNSAKFLRLERCKKNADLGDVENAEKVISSYYSVVSII